MIPVCRSIPNLPSRYLSVHFGELVAIVPSMTRMGELPDKESSCPTSTPLRPRTYCTKTLNRRHLETNVMLGFLDAYVLEYQSTIREPIHTVRTAWRKSIQSAVSHIRYHLLFNYLPTPDPKLTTQDAKPTLSALSNMTQPFSGKVIFITGAGSGIGRATAIKLASLGATLFLTDINPSSVQETRTLCSGDSHNTRVLDVAQTSACTAAIALAISHHDKIDHIFNCAGVNPTPYALEDTTDEYWDKLMNVNLRGTYAITRAAIPYLRPGSSIVNVSSICGVQPTANIAIYCATKYGLIGFSKAMALELGMKGVRVNVIAPGFIDTPTNASVVAGEESVRRIEGKISLGRMGVPEECADVVAFLMGEGAGYVNGSVIEVNGGMAT